MASTHNEHLRCVEELYTETASLTGLAPEKLHLDDVLPWNEVQRKLALGHTTGPRHSVFTVNPGTPQRPTRETSKRTRVEKRVVEEEDDNAEDMEAAEKLLFMTMKRAPTPPGERPVPVEENETTVLGKRYWPPRIFCVVSVNPTVLNPPPLQETTRHGRRGRTPRDGCCQRTLECHSATAPVSRRRR